MEFAELIKTPNRENVLMTDLLGRTIRGTLCITSHHLIMSSREDGGKEDVVVSILLNYSKLIHNNVFKILHSDTDVVEKKPNMNMTGGTLVVKCKNFRIISLEIDGWVELNNIATSIECLSNLNDVRLLYPYFYNPDFNFVEDGWSLFRTETEFSNLFTFTDGWRISSVNKNFDICPTYPELVIVPKAIPDDSLIAISKFRCLGRFPVLSYCHRATKAALMRCGQPLVGTSTKRCKDDEKLINLVLGSGKRGFIIETRTESIAQQAKTKGGGVEPESNYPLWKRVHKPIDGHSSLLDSLRKLLEGM